MTEAERLESEALSLYKTKRKETVEVYAKNFNIEEEESMSDLYDEAYEHGRQSVLIKAKSVLNLLTEELDGYKTVPNPNPHTCIGCALDEEGYCDTIACDAVDRTDKRDIIFKKLEPAKAEQKQDPMTECRNSE